MMNGFIKQPFGFVMKVEFPKMTLPRRPNKTPTVSQYQSQAFWPLNTFAPFPIEGGTFEVYCQWDGSRWFGSWIDPSGIVIEVMTYAKQPRSTGTSYSDTNFRYTVPELLKNVSYSGPEQAGTYINIYNDTNRPTVKGNVTVRGVSQAVIATIGGGKFLPEFEIPLQNMEFVSWGTNNYLFEAELPCIYNFAIGFTDVYYPVYGDYKFTPSHAQSVIGVKTQRSDIAVFNDGEPFYPSTTSANRTSAIPTKADTGTLVLYHVCTTYESTFISWNDTRPVMFAVKIVSGVPTSYLGQIRGWGSGTEAYGGIARGMWDNRGSAWDGSQVIQRYSVTSDLAGPDFYPDIGDILHFEEGFIYPGGGWRQFDVEVVMIDENDPDQRNLVKPTWHVDTAANSTAFYRNDAPIHFDIVSGSGSATVSDFSARVYAGSVTMSIEFVPGTSRTQGTRYTPNDERAWDDTVYPDESGSLVNVFAHYRQSTDTLELPHQIEIVYSADPDGYYEFFNPVQSETNNGINPIVFFPLHIFEVPQFNNNSPKWSKTLEYIDTVDNLTGYEQRIPITAGIDKVLWDPIARETIEFHENDV